MEKYLKPKQYYSDLYDRGTVEICRRWLAQPVDTKAIRNKAKEKKMDEDKAESVMATANRLYLYFQTGDRYIKKEETILKWMERDEKGDKFIETVTAPEDITCLTCERLMFVSSNHFNLGFEEEPDTMLFMYDCPLGHLPRRAFYNNGEEFKRDKPLCPKCGTSVNEDDQTTEEKFVTYITCPNCDYKDTREIERSVNKEPKPDPNYERDRAEFCLSGKKGQEFIEAKRSLEDLSELMKGFEEKEKNKDIYDGVAQLKKLKITELEELLTPVLEKAGYIKLQFKNPEINKDVFVPFIVYDHKAERGDRKSASEVEKLIRKTLCDTNWRLMTGGVNYRLGMLEGRLHGYDREEDLVKLIENK